MQIELKELHLVCEKLLLYLEAQGVEQLHLPVDYYWNIPKKEVYDPYKKPSTLDIGQLTDDWQELRKMLTSEDQPLAYHFVWLAAILRALGEFTEP